MMGKPRVVDLLHRRVGEQVRRDQDRVRALAVETNREGLDAALHEVAVERARHRAGGVLDETEVGSQLLVAGRDEPAHDIGVPAQVLGRGVHDGVGTQAERLLEVGRGEGVVDDTASAMSVRNCGDSLDVDDLELRIAGCLHPHQAGLIAPCGRQRVGALEASPART